MGAERPLPRSQDIATGLNPKPDESNPYQPILFH
jgi:hypothetical protein